MELRLNLDARNRVNLSGLLPDLDVHTVIARTEGNKIILEPMAEIPASELWLYKNPKALKAVHEGLKESAEGKTRKRGSFAQYADDDI